MYTHTPLWYKDLCVQGLAMSEMCSLRAGVPADVCTMGLVAGWCPGRWEGGDSTDSMTLHVRHGH